MFFLKERWKNGGPYQRKWAMEEIKKRWQDMKPDEQLDLIFDDEPIKKEIYG